jgi:hypothetical protein
MRQGAELELFFELELDGVHPAEIELVLTPLVSLLPGKKDLGVSV